MRAKLHLAAVAPLLLLGLNFPLQQQSIDLQLSAEPGQHIDIDLPGVTGQIEIVGGNGDTVSVEGTVSAREWRDDNEVIVDQTGSGIRIYSEYLENRRRDGRDSRRMRAQLTIRIPRRFDVELNSAMDTTVRDLDGHIVVWTGNSDLVVSGLTGEADLGVANGNLRIADSDLEGELSNTNGSLRLVNGSFRGELSSTNGGAEIDRVSGDLRIDATNGSVEMGDVVGSIRGDITNGSVRAASVSGNIEFETINGNVTATLVGEGSAGGDRVKIETLNGSVEIEAPANLSATFDLEVRQTEAGRRRRDRPEIRSDFALDVSPGTVNGDEYRRTATGRTGTGEQRIEVRATNGNVIIRSSG